MYEVVVSNGEYQRWDLYHRWWRAPMMYPFNIWVVANCPEVYGCEYDDVNRQFEFLFESEEHYYWFLLKVM